jgi:hypothetical protein
MAARGALLAQPCYCGHTRTEHLFRSRTGRCLVCPDRHFFEKPEMHDRLLRERAAAADPEHVHGPTHTAYACPGFVPFQVCDVCGTWVS